MLAISEQPGSVLMIKVTLKVMASGTRRVV